MGLVVLVLDCISFVPDYTNNKCLHGYKNVARFWSPVANNELRVERWDSINKRSKNGHFNFE